MSKSYHKKTQSKNRRCHWYNELGWPRLNPTRPKSDQYGCNFPDIKCHFAHPDDLQWNRALLTSPPSAHFYPGGVRPPTPPPQSYSRPRTPPPRQPKLEHHSPKLSDLFPESPSRGSAINDRDRENTRQPLNRNGKDIDPSARAPSPSGSRASDSISLSRSRLASRFSPPSGPRRSSRDFAAQPEGPRRRYSDNFDMDVDRDHSRDRDKERDREREKDRVREPGQSRERERLRDYDRTNQRPPYTRDNGWGDRQKGGARDRREGKSRDATPDRDRFSGFSRRSPSPRSTKTSFGTRHPFDTRDNDRRRDQELDHDRERDDDRDRERRKQPVQPPPPPRPPSAAGSNSAFTPRKDATPTQSTFNLDTVAQERERNQNASASLPFLERDHNPNTHHNHNAVVDSSQFIPPPPPPPISAGAASSISVLENRIKSRSASTLSIDNAQTVVAPPLPSMPPPPLPRDMSRQQSDVTMVPVAGSEEIKPELTREQRKETWRKRIELLAESLKAHTSHQSISENLESLRKLAETPRYKDLSLAGRANLEKAVQEAEIKRKAEEQRIHDTMEKLVLEEFWPTQQRVVVQPLPTGKQYYGPLPESGEVTPLEAETADMGRMKRDYEDLTNKVKKLDETLQEVMDWMRETRAMGVSTVPPALPPSIYEASTGTLSEQQASEEIDASASVPRGKKRRRVVQDDGENEEKHHMSIKELSNRLSELDVRVAEVENTANVWEQDLEGAVKLRVDDLMESVQDRLGVANVEHVEKAITRIEEELGRSGADVQELADDMIGMMRDVDEGKKTLHEMKEGNARMKEMLEMLQANQQADHDALMHIQVEYTATKLETDQLLEQIAERKLLEQPPPPSTSSTLSPPPPPFPRDLLEAHMYTFAQSPNMEELVKAMEEGRANIEKAVAGIDLETIEELRALLNKSMEVGVAVTEWLEKADIPLVPPATAPMKEVVQRGVSAIGDLT